MVVADGVGAGVSVGATVAQAARLHSLPHVGNAERQLNVFLAALIAEGATEGTIRSDMAPEALAGYCLHALGAASGLAPDAALQLTGIIMTGLRPVPQRSISWP